MVTKSPQLCRLCLQTSDDVVNIWDTFQDSTVASVLAKHFWFQIRKNDGLTEWLCEICWIQTKTFHEFYKQVELFQKCFLDSVAKDGVDDAGVNSVDASLEPELNEVECEDIELTIESIDSQISNEESLDCIDDYRALSPHIDAAKHNLPSSLGIKEMNAQIRELFTMKCDICSNVEFVTLLGARRHYRSVHNTEGYLMCCGEKLWRRQAILNHIRYHVFPDTYHDEKDQSSEKRAKNGEDNRMLPPHLEPKKYCLLSPSEREEETARIREVFTMKCDICCDVEFESLLDVRRHYRRIHKTKGYLICCGKKFWSRHLILNHIRFHVYPNAFSCDHCGKSFYNKNLLKNHMSYHIPRDLRAHKCSLCSSSFAKATLLKSHVQNKHTSKTGENFPCEKCNKNFRSKLLLACHIRGVHESSLEHVCEICARAFKTKQLLENHIYCTHSEAPKAQCNICGAWLKNEMCLRKHLRQHEDGYSEVVKCPICKKDVKNKTALAGHIRSVHGERRHQCTLCDKAFKCAKNLNEHIACHTGEDLYDCPYCEKKFKSNANLYSHRKKAHVAEWSRDFPQRITLINNSTNKVTETQLNTKTSQE